MKNNSENYLERIPVINSEINWSIDENSIVTLEIENKGITNRLFQKLFKKPKISYIHLDELGSFVWQLIDGTKSITELAADVKKHFGDKAEPLYERLAQYFQILNSYKFIDFK